MGLSQSLTPKMMVHLHTKHQDGFTALMHCANFRNNFTEEQRFDRSVGSEMEEDDRSHNRALSDTAVHVAVRLSIPVCRPWVHVFSRLVGYVTMFLLGI